MPGENAPSLPVRECGLKLPDNTTKRPLLHVTPCAGVWIEIGMRDSWRQTLWSLPVRECGLKCECVAEYHA